MFGHHIPFNFNGNSTHNTFIGGVTSIVIKAFMIIFVTVNFIKLATFNDDTLNTTQLKVNLEEAGSIKYDGRDQLIFWSLKKLGKGNTPLKLKDIQKDLTKKPYLQIDFYQKKVDWDYFNDYIMAAAKAMLLGRPAPENKMYQHDVVRAR